MSDQEWKEPGDTVYLDISEVNAFQTQIFLPSFNGGGYGKDPNKIFQMSSKVARSALRARTAMEQEYQRRAAELPTHIQAEMSNNGVQNIYAETISDSRTLQNDQSIINQLIQQKNGSLQKHMREANSFYGSDPHTKSESEYIVHFNRHMRQDRSPGSTNTHWVTSYLAGYSVKLDTESIRLLTDRSNQLHTAYTQALAREEVARQAEAQAREAAARQAEAQAREAAAQQAEAQAREAAAQQAEAQAREAAALQVERERSESNLKAKSLTTAIGASASVKPLSISADGVIEGYDVFPTSWSDLDPRKIEIAAKAISRLAGLFAAALYSPSLGNGELQRTPVVLSMPLSHLTGGVTNESDLRASYSVSLPFRVTSKRIGEHTQLYLSPTGNSLSDKVRVREIKLDSSTNLYTFTTEGHFPRTLTWTPNNAPGHDALGSTELPVDRPDIKIYPGSRVTPVEGRTDEHPAHDDDATDDYILWFPKESGIDPVYIMASRSGPRYEPGTATGTGQPAEGNWLGNALTGGAAIPSQVADQLRGKNFKNFDEFRERLWRTVSIDSKLSEQLNPLNRSIAQKGYSPYAPRKEQVGGREKLEIHHITPISEGGEVYNIENMVIMTPKAHIAEHSKNSGSPL